MATEKLSRILRSRSHFSDDEIADMSDVDGWNWVYANAGPRKAALPQVCFTGFSATAKEQLISLASANHLEVVGSVTKNLAFLCCGETPGQSKVEKAKAQAIPILNERTFLHLLETGEILLS